MNIVVFGANGKVGSLVVAELLKRGHRVVAFVYGKSSHAASDSLRIYQGDVRNRDDVDAALTGCDAVLSTLGSWGTKSKDILSEGMKCIVPAMEAKAIKRIVSLTGSAARAPGDKWGFADKVSRQFLGLIAPKILKDAEIHVSLLFSSNLDWTILRSPVMNNHGSTTYTLNVKPPRLTETINRQAVALAMVDMVEQGGFLNEAPHLHRG